MTDLLETPVGDFEWGPDRRSHRIRDWLATCWLHRVFPQLALGLGAALLVIGVGLLVTTSQSRSTLVDVLSTDQPSAVEPTQNSAAEAEPSEILAPRLVVHVSGQVAKPGIVELVIPARIFHAIEAAGGALPTADLTQLNLAAPLDDGSRLHVPSPQETSALRLTRPNTGEPDTREPDTGELDTDTGEPATQPEGGANQSDEEELDTEPDTGGPDTRDPDTGEPDTDTRDPDTGKPDTDTRDPDTGKPDTDTGELDTGEPDTDTGELVAEADGPETSDLIAQVGEAGPGAPLAIEGAPTPTPHRSADDSGP